MLSKLLCCVALVSGTLMAQGQSQRPRMDVSDYTIDAQSLTLEAGAAGLQLVAR